MEENVTFNLGKDVYYSFDEYVADWHEGESYRNWLGDKFTLRIIRGRGPHSGLPGGYLWACVVKYFHPKTKTYSWGVHVNDNDDGSCSAEFVYEVAALQWLKNLTIMAPFTMWELTEFEFEF